MLAVFRRQLQDLQRGCYPPCGVHAVVVKPGLHFRGGLPCGLRAQMQRVPCIKFAQRVFHCFENDALALNHCGRFARENFAIDAPQALQHESRSPQTFKVAAHRQVAPQSAPGLCAGMQHNRSKALHVHRECARTLANFRQAAPTCSSAFVFHNKLFCWMQAARWVSNLPQVLLAAARQ